MDGTCSMPMPYLPMLSVWVFLLHHEEQVMAKELDDKALDKESGDKDLDQYGVWVKSEGSDINDGPGNDATLLDIEESGETTSTDDLDDLNDLLLSIDEESDNDETVYLEEDDLSLDLESDTQDLLLDVSSHDQETASNELPDFNIPMEDGEEITLTIEDEENNDNANFFATPEEQSAFSEQVDDVPENTKLETGSNFTDLNIGDELEPPNDGGLDLEEGLIGSLDTQSLATTALPEDGSLENESDVALDDEDISFDIDEDVDTESFKTENVQDSENDMVDIVMDEASNAEIPKSDDDDLSFDLSGFDDFEEEPKVDDETTFDTDLTFNVDSDPSSESALDENIEQSSVQENFDDVGAVTSDLFDEEIEPLSEQIDEPAAETPDAKNNVNAAEQPVIDSPSSQDTGTKSALLGIEKELQAIRHELIDTELKAIRSELVDLRSELKRLREREPAPADTSFSLDGVEQAPVDAFPAVTSSEDELSIDDQFDEPSATEEPSIEESDTSTPSGFFDDDEDETVALTGDELDNILNSAEFTEQVGEPSIPDDDLSFEGIQTPAVSSEPQPAFEQLVPESTPPIEEINLEEISEQGKSQFGDETLSDESQTNDPFAGNEDEVESMASIDIEKELEGIENLHDDEQEIDSAVEDEISNIELDLPESLKIDTPVPEPEIQELPSDHPEAEAVSTPPASSDTEALTDGMPYNIKQEIKSVLAYMDQLLDALPQEKIAEFARSEHYDVYKKLFEELGI